MKKLFFVILLVFSFAILTGCGKNVAANSDNKETPAMSNTDQTENSLLDQQPETEESEETTKTPGGLQDLTPVVIDADTANSFLSEDSKGRLIFDIEKYAESLGITFFYDGSVQMSYQTPNGIARAYSIHNFFAFYIPTEDPEVTRIVNFQPSDYHDVAEDYEVYVRGENVRTRGINLLAASVIGMQWMTQDDACNTDPFDDIKRVDLLVRGFEGEEMPDFWGLEYEIIMELEKE